MQDIDIKTDKNRFKLRVSGLIIENNKLLVHEMRNKKGYCIPGGHVELGELSTDAIKREMAEELKISIDIIELCIIDENIYNENDMTYQEINYYFKIKSITSLPKDTFKVSEIDKGEFKEHIFHWLDIKSLDKNTFYPTHIGKLLSANITCKNKLLISDQRK